MISRIRVIGSTLAMGLMLSVVGIRPASAASLLYSTYLGGTVEDRVNAIALDSSGSVYLTGLTVSGSFPGSAGGYQPAIAAGTDAFVTKITAAGAIAWSTYLGGNGTDIANAIGVDGLGIVHITGQTTSTNFPTATPYQAANAGGTDAFVTAINAGGTALVYSTYLGGAGVEDGFGLAVDAAGNVYVTGDTTSNATTFPQTAGVYQPTAGGASDAFISKFSPAGGRLYSTFLGGTGADLGRAVAIDGIGNAYVTGQAADAFFPTASYPNVFKPTITGAYDAFIAKLSATGATLDYVTYVGGSGIDDAYGIALDGADPATLKIYITGYTFSADFPKSGFATVGQLTIGTAPDAYVFKLDMNGGGGNLDGVYSTYLGGSADDRATAIKVDTAGNVYVTGRTTAGDFPTVNPIQGTLTGTGMVFVTEIGPTGAIRVFSTYLGGVTDQQGNGIGLDSKRNIYVTGWTNSTDYPMASPFQAANAGSVDGFLTKISAPSPVPTSLPVITSVPPSRGVSTGGTTVVIGGSGFTDVAGAAGVTFGGVNAASYVVDSDTQITTRTKAHAAAVVDVVVTNVVGASLNGPAARYTFFLSPGEGDPDPYLFPSPTDGVTVGIVYSMTAGPGLVNVRMYNEIGDLATELEERKPAGLQSSIINIGALAPGVYYYRVTLTFDDGTTKQHDKRKFAVVH